MVKLRTFSVATLICGLICLFAGAVIPLVYINRALQGGTAIIGGVDGPTYRFLVMWAMDGWPVFLMLLGAALVITALFCLVFRGAVRKHCHISTTLLALGMSATGMLGLVCVMIWGVMFAFSDFDKYPIRHPVCVITGLVCACLLVYLATWYYRVRKVRWSGVGLVLDITVGVLYLPCFFQFIACVEKLLS